MKSSHLDALLSAFNQFKCKVTARDIMTKHRLWWGDIKNHTIHMSRKKTLHCQASFQHLCFVRFKDVAATIVLSCHSSLSLWFAKSRSAFSLQPCRVNVVSGARCGTESIQRQKNWKWPFVERYWWNSKHYSEQVKCSAVLKKADSATRRSFKSELNLN